MKQINKTLRLAGILVLCINALNVGNLILDIYFGEHVAYYVTIDAISIALTFATGIVYLCLHKKSEEYLVNHKAIFVTLLWLNILNNLFVWIISLWVEIMVSGLQKKFLFTEMRTEENSEDVVLLQVNDVDTVTLGVDVGSHFGVPTTGLVTEVYAGLQQLLHRYDSHF